MLQETVDAESAHMSRPYQAIGSYQAMIGYQETITRQWLKTLMSLVCWYTSLLDPRPDLAVPARSIKTPYAWWW